MCLDLQQTSSMSLADEKKLIKEIEQLKTSKKTAAQFMSQEEVRAKQNRRFFVLDYRGLCFQTRDFSGSEVY